MTPKHSLAVDPFLLHALGLLDRIGSGGEPNPHEERIRLKALLDQGEAIVGVGREWELSKYALVSWIDEMVVDSSWTQGDWWSNNVMEMELFNTRACNEQFYVHAKEASTLGGRDSLEVHYVCVVLGFRGLYRDPQLAQMMASHLGLPTDLQTWAKQTVMSIRLGQGRPALRGPSREIQGAPPLAQKSMLVWPWLFACMLLIWNTIYAMLFLVR